MTIARVDRPRRAPAAAAGASDADTLSLRRR